MKFSKIHVLIFIASFALTTLFVWLLLPSNKSKENIYFRQGYDFRKLRFANSDIDTLKIGEKLEVANIKSTQGKSISSFSDEPLFLLIATDPGCPACNLSNDMMEDVRNTAESIKVAYYPILITSTSPTIDMDKYAKKLGFNDYFYWSSESPIPNSLKQLITPTHILINKDGMIIQVWYGSNKDEDVRKRMSNQISADLLLINDIYKAMLADNKLHK